MAAVLALDLGTNTGFAIRRDDGRVESGTEKFSRKAKESSGARFNRFRRWLVEVKEKNPDLALVAVENVAFIGGENGAYAMQVYGAFKAIVEMFCAHHGLPEPVGFAVSTLKLRFTGSGKASKDDVIKQCRLLGFNVPPDAHNEADAIAVLHVATDTCPLLTMNGASSKKRTPKPAPELKPGEMPF